MSSCKCRLNIEEILKKHGKDKRLLVQILQDIQKNNNYLSKEALQMVADFLELPIAKVYSVASFYKAFCLKPRGENLLLVCTGTACHVKGSKQILDSIKDKLNIKEGQTSSDNKYTLEAVNCVGACAMAPLVIVNDRSIGPISLDEVDKIIT